MYSNEANNVNTPFKIYLIMLFIWTWNWFPVQLILYVELCVQRHKAIIRFAETKRQYIASVNSEYADVAVPGMCIQTKGVKAWMRTWVNALLVYKKYLILFICNCVCTIKVVSLLQLHIAYKPSAKKIYLAMKK